MIEQVTRRILEVYALMLFLGICFYASYGVMPADVKTAFIGFGLLTVLSLHALRQSLVLRFMMALFTMIVSWRIGVLYHIPVVLNGLFLGFFILKVFYFINLVHEDLSGHRISKKIPLHYMSPYEWQLLFIRLYIGLDLIPHFTEKLFAGPVRLSDVKAFEALGVPHAYEVVILSGLIEFAGAISISFGFLTRLGSICLFIYLMFASFLGHHFSLGFIWASSGGGWEYPVFWATLVLTFSVFAPYKFSVDAYLQRVYTMPHVIKKLMGS